MYEAEASVAKSGNFEYFLIDFEALVIEANLVKALRRVKAVETSYPVPALYRGWMLSPEHYALLYAGLLERGFQLINDPDAYKHCHYLPEWYPLLEGSTPRSVWLELSSSPPDFEQIMTLLKAFGSSPLILKDFVKSRKHEWLEACYIPAASNRDEVVRVVNKFIELQGPELAGGLVFREFIEFENIGVHSKSGMPLTAEFRFFFLDQQPIFWTHYWEEGNYANISFSVDQFKGLARRIKSRFFTMDVARHKDGNWLVIELGDGQVAGLPDDADLVSFYQALQKE
jgi:hypothetical protein